MGRQREQRNAGQFGPKVISPVAGLQAVPTPESEADIAWSLAEFEKRRALYANFRSYYDGKQKLMVRAERVKTVFGDLFKDYRVNLCGPVVDAVADRLQIAGFSDAGTKSGEAKEGEQGTEGENPIEADAAAVWERNLMALGSGEVHQESLSTGDSYVIVWPGADDEPVMYLHNAHEVVIRYRSDRPGAVSLAAKMWREDLPAVQQMPGFVYDEEGNRQTSFRKVGTVPAVRLNLYYEDRIEKYAARRGRAGTWPKAASFEPYSPDPEDGDSWRVENEWGQVPVFHFPNTARLGRFGTSELKDAIPIQDETNYHSFGLLLNEEHTSFPVRVLLNIEDPTRDANGDTIPGRLQIGPDRWFALKGLPKGASGEEGAHPPQVMELAPGDLSPFERAYRLGAIKMATVTGTPVHHFLPTEEGPATPVSGESQKVADEKLTNKVRDRQIAFGVSWAAAVALAVRMKRGLRDPGAVSLRCNWHDTRPRNEREQWEIAQLKRQAGVPWQRILEEMGYSKKEVQDFEETKVANAERFGPQEGGTRTFADVLDDVTSQSVGG
jgi:hypothetical protein